MAVYYKQSTNKNIKGKTNSENEGVNESIIEIPNWVGSKQTFPPSFSITKKIGHKKLNKTKLYKVSHSAKLDKLSFTYPATSQDEEIFFMNTLKGFVDDGNGSILPNKGSYHLTVSLQLIANEKLTIQAKPYNDNNNFLRFVWNPSKNLGGGHEKLQDVYLHLLFPNGFNTNKIRITRLDTAIDFNFVKSDQLMIHAPYYKVGRTFLNGVGNIETHYVGTNQSTREFVLYDKQKEQKKKGVDIPKTTRFESRFRPQQSVYLPEVLTEEPFKGVKIYYAPPPPNVEEHEWGYFLSYAQTYGLLAALRKLPKHLRHKYRECLEKFIVSWWQPDKFQLEYENAVKQLLTELKIDY